MGSEEEDHKGEVPFSSHHGKATCCHCVLLLMALNLAEVSYCKFTLFSLFLLYYLAEQPTLKRQGIKYKLFGILYRTIFSFPYLLIYSVID